MFARWAGWRYFRVKKKLDMRKLIALLTLMCAAIGAHAQFYGNSLNPYDTPESRQWAYEWGQQLARQQNEQQERSDRSNFGACTGRIYKAIANRDFAEAKKWAQHMGSMNKGMSYYYLGLCSELQGAPNTAKQYYNSGISYGNTYCKTLLNRLQQYGPMTATQKNNIVMNFKGTVAKVGAMSAQAVNEMFSGSSSGSSRSSRRSSGVCSRCHGTGIDPIMVDYNPGSRTASGRINAYKTCPYCGERKSTAHWHQRCLDCRTR